MGPQVYENRAKKPTPEEKEELVMGEADEDDTEAQVLNLDQGAKIGLAESGHVGNSERKEVEAQKFSASELASEQVRIIKENKARAEKEVQAAKEKGKVEAIMELANLEGDEEGLAEYKNDTLSALEDTVTQLKNWEEKIADSPETETMGWKNTDQRLQELRKDKANLEGALEEINKNSSESEDRMAA